MHSDAQRQEWRAYNQRRRKWARIKGMCSRCLAREKAPGVSTCKECQAKLAARRAKA